MEKVLNEEIIHWKTQANKYQSELDKKTKEIIDVYSDKKKAEEECLKAYRNLDISQRENLEIQKKLSETDTSVKKECSSCESFKREILVYNELIEEFKKTEEKNLNQIKDLQDMVSRPSSVASKQSKSKPIKKIPKKTLEFDKQPISETENQFANEIVNLNKQLNKLKYENKAQSELLKKCQHERDELKKLMLGKDEALNRIRKENDSLSISLSTDYYKSMHKLEHTSIQAEQQNKELLIEINALQKAKEEMKKNLEAVNNENNTLKNQIKELQESIKPQGESQKIVENLSSLQNQFYRLKEMSDRQIQMIECLKQENFQLMQSIESYKSIARSAKLHADKASGDAEAYVAVIKKIENELAQANYLREIAEAEVNTLKQHLMKLLNSR